MAPYHEDGSRQPWRWENVEVLLQATPDELPNGDLVNGLKQLVSAGIKSLNSKGLGQIPKGP